MAEIRKLPPLVRIRQTFPRPRVEAPAGNLTLRVESAHGDGSRAAFCQSGGISGVRGGSLDVSPHRASTLP